MQPIVFHCQLTLPTATLAGVGVGVGGSVTIPLGTYHSSILLHGMGGGAILSSVANSCWLGVISTRWSYGWAC